MSAVSLLSVLTPAAPAGASLDASAEAATDSAVFAGLMLKEGAPTAAPTARTAEGLEIIVAAEPARDDAAVAPAPPVWFAPPPTPQPEPLEPAADPSSPAPETNTAPAAAELAAEPPAVGATTPAPPADHEVAEPVPTFDRLAQAGAPTDLSGTAPSAEAVAPPAPSATLVTAADAAKAAAIAAPVVPLKAAIPAASAQTDASPEASAAEGESEGDAPAAPRPTPPALSAQTAALQTLTGVRSGAGERLASARDALQAAMTATDGAETPASARLAPSDAPADAATASAARPAVAPAPVVAVSASSPAAPSPEADPAAAPLPPAEAAAPQAPGAHRDLGLSQLSRATVETTAQIAAQIIRKLDGRSTRFDMALTPEGLGRVDVSLEIESDGQVTARLAFDNPAAAADLRARADELRRQLLDAGLQVSPDDLEFAERDPSSGFGDGAFERQPDRRAFAGAARLAAEADAAVPPPGAWTSLSLTPDRVDLKV
ncbi:flagellar hook-length control protein FliK [Brevundimonas diminuta]|uniref:flagellar hook-length control protein FliK n=1 Tax=Brevundimonas diminuta TaxID=293 RepID=UPI00320A2D4F